MVLLLVHSSWTNRKFNILSSIKETDYSTYAYKAFFPSFFLFFVFRKWVKARKKINWHCTLLQCSLLLLTFFLHHHLVRCPIDHFDYHQEITSYILVSSISMKEQDKGCFVYVRPSLVKDHLYLSGLNTIRNERFCLF